MRWLQSHDLFSPALCQHAKDLNVKHQWRGNYNKRCFCVDTRVNCQVKSTYPSPHFCCTLFDPSFLLSTLNSHTFTLNGPICYEMHALHQRSHTTKLDCIADANRLTCFRALICHFAAEGKTSLPARKAAEAAARWCEPCWWAPSPPRPVPPSAAHPAFPSLRPQWRFHPPALTNNKHKQVIHKYTSSYFGFSTRVV